MDAVHFPACQNRGVPDHLYYSCWIRGFSAMNMLRHYGRCLELFPYSPQNPGDSVLRIQAISPAEPPLLERAFVDPIAPAEVSAAAAEFHAADACYNFDTWWGLWTFEKDWSLHPSRAAITCFGPQFEEAPRGDDGIDPEHIRLDFGLESWFLPDANLPNSAWYARSNLKGLLKLIHAIDEALPIERRSLWSESGINFAERLQQAAADL